MKLGVFACSFFECLKGAGLSRDGARSGYAILRPFPSKRLRFYSDPRGAEDEPVPRNVFVRSVAHIIQKTDRWDALLKGLHDASACEITPAVAVQVLKRIKKPEVAFKFFTWLGEREGYSHDGLCYSAIIEVLTKGRDPSHAAIAGSLLRAKTEELGLAATAVDYDRVLRRWACVGRPDLGLSLLHEMTAHGFIPSADSCRALLEELFRSGRDGSASAWQLFEHALGRKIAAPRPVIFNVAMKSLCVEGRLEGALELFDKMKAEGYEPDLDSFNILIKGCCEKGEADRLRELLKDMIHLDLRPDSYTMNLLIKELCKLGKPEHGSLLFNHMRRVGWIDRKFVYSQLVESLCDHGWWLKAHKIFIKMVRRGHHPKPVLYDTLLRHLCMGDRLPEAYKLKDLTLKKGVLPGVHAYHGLINGLCLANRMDLVDKLLSEIDGHGLRLDPRTSNAVLRGHCLSRDAKAALWWLRKMRAEGFKPDEGSCEILLGCLGEQEKVDAPCSSEERISCVISELVKSNCHAPSELLN